MTVSDTRLYRRLLLALRGHLRGEINLLVDIALDVVLDDVPPIPQRMCGSCRPIWRMGTARTVKHYIEHLIEAKEEMLALVENALTRLDAGSYGACRHCGAAISTKQLVSTPYKALCADCDSRRPPNLDVDSTQITHRRLFRG